MNSKLQVIIDWLQFTIKSLEVEDVIIDVLYMNLDDFIPVEKGNLGYKKQQVSGNIRILYDGNEGMGIHVIISGEGCREYEEKNNILELIDRINGYDGKISRIDIAIDDETGKIIPFEKILRDVRAGNIVSRWRSSIEIIKRDIQKGERTGQTVMLGSRKSDVCMRIYDKALEQKKAKGEQWVRMELEIKKEKAIVIQSLLPFYEKNIGKMVSKIVNNYVRIVEKSKDKNKSRWKTKRYWKNIVKETEKLSLTRRPEERTIKDVRNWVRRQVSPSLAVLLLDAGGDIKSLLSIINEGKTRLKSKHFNMLRGGK